LPERRANMDMYRTCKCGVVKTHMFDYSRQEFRWIDGNYAVDNDAVVFIITDPNCYQDAVLRLRSVFSQGTVFRELKYQIDLVKTKRFKLVFWGNWVDNPMVDTDWFTNLLNSL
jgi:hypothetical protein